MLTTAEIAEIFQRNIGQKRPIFSETPLDTNSLVQVVSDMIDPQTFKVDSPTIVSNVDSVFIRGTTRLFGYSDLAIETGFEIMSSSCQFFLRARLANLPTFAFFSQLNALVKDVSFDWRYGPLDDLDTDFFPALSMVRFGTSLSLGGVELPIAITPPVTDGMWQLNGDFDQPVKLPNLDTLLHWLPVDNAGQALPPAIRDIEGLGMTSLSMSFEPEAKQIASASIALELNRMIRFIPNTNRLNLLDGLLAVSISRDDNNKTDIHASVYGDLQLGDTMIGVCVGFDTALKHTTFNLTSDNLVLPSLDTLAALVGGKKMLTALPPAFRKAESVLLKALAVELESSGGLDASVVISCGAAVPLHSGLSIENVDVVLEASPASDNPFSATFNALLQAGSEPVSIEGQLSRMPSFSGYIPEISLGELAASFVPKLPKGLKGVVLNDVTVNFDGQGNLVFNATSHIATGELCTALGITLPNGFPTDIDLSVIRLSIDFTETPDVSLEVEAELSSPVRFPSSSVNSLDLDHVSFNWSSTRGVGGEIGLSGRVAPVPEISLSLQDLLVTYSTEGGWAGTAVVDGELYGKAVKGFVAKFADGAFSIERIGGTPLTLLNVRDVAMCVVDKILIFVTKESNGDKKNSSQWEYDITGAGTITVGPQRGWGFAVPFSIELKNQALVLEATKVTPITIPLGPSNSQVDVMLYFDDLKVEFSKENGLYVGGTGHGRLKNLPDVVKDCFPETFPTLKLEASTKRLKVDCDLSGTGLAPSIDLFQVGKSPKSPRLQVTKMEIDLGKSPSMSSFIHVDQLAPLNYIFGKKDDGTPKVDFLNDAFDVRLTLGAQPKLKLELEHGSPFKDLKLKQGDDGPYFVWDLGRGLNRFKVNVPTLVWQNDAWAGSGGLEIMDGKPLLLPLGPLKYVLSQLGVPNKVLNAIPSSVPIDVFDINKHKTFRSVLVDALSSKTKVDKLYQSQAAGDVLNEFDKTVWQTIRHGVELMPMAFRPFASPPDIQKIQINVGAKPGGGWTGGVSTGDTKPIKFMLPFVGGLIPELIGLTINRFELGQAMGGLATFKVDGQIDQFDLITLIVAASNPATKLLSKKRVENLCNQIRLSDVFGVVVPAFPVPLPILYDKIHWDYKNWWGLDGTSDWTFKLGEHTDIWALLGALSPFFTSSSYHLADPKNRAQDQLRLTLAVGPNCITLPDYLGGKTIGPQSGTPSLPADISVRWWLDACKFLNPGYALRSVPLKDPQNGKFIRLGHEDITFGPLEFYAGWCITTEDEFRKEIIGDPEAEAILNAIDINKTLQHLPKSKGVAYDKGFIVVLGGGASLASVLVYRAQFGIAVTSTGGFQTRIWMEGGIENVVTLTIDGGIQVQRDRATKIDGTGDLKVAGMSLIKLQGLIEVDDQGFTVKVILTLADAIQVAGELHIGNDGVYIELGSGIAWTYAKGKQIKTSLKTYARFDADGMLIALKGQSFFGASCTVGLYVNSKGAVGVRIDFDLAGLNKIFIGQINQAFAAATEEVNKQSPGFAKLVEENASKARNFDDIRKGLPAILDKIRNTVRTTVYNRAGQEYKKLNWWEKAAVNVYYGVSSGGGKKLQADARNQADKFLTPLNTLARQLRVIEQQKIKDPRERVRRTRVDILNALDKSIALNGTSYNVKVWKITVKKVKIRFDTKPLVELKNLVNKLPDDWSKEDNARAKVAKTLAGRTQVALKDITKSIEKSVKDQIPQIQSITVDTSLRLLNGPQLSANVKIKEGQKIRTLVADINASNMIQSVSEITKKFVQAIT